MWRRTIKSHVVYVAMLISIGCDKEIYQKKTNSLNLHGFKEQVISNLSDEFDCTFTELTFNEPITLTSFEDAERIDTTIGFKVYDELFVDLEIKNQLQEDKPKTLAQDFPHGQGVISLSQFGVSKNQDFIAVVIVIYFGPVYASKNLFVYRLDKKRKKVLFPACFNYVYWVS